MGKTVLSNEWNMSWFADYDANGTYVVRASVDNGEQKVDVKWNLIVKNTNRKPLIDTFEPEKKYMMDENSSAIFTVGASDPDKDALTYAWYVDGKRVTATGEETTYEYKTGYASAGKHEVKVVVADTGGATTPFTWEVTVNNVNAAPEIPDSSPPLDEVTMNENSTKKFGITDLSLDGDKHVVSWSLDGNSTGVTGRTYEYVADFESAGRHEVRATASDGRLETVRTWTVVVVDVNRPPVAGIAQPAPAAEYMLGGEITLDGSRSTDPDGDSLSMTWMEGLKTLGTGQTATVKLAKGKHTIVLKVDDGRKNGVASAQVTIYVRYIDFSGSVSTEEEAPVEGKQLKVQATLTMRGDGELDEASVAFKVDGTEITTVTIDNIGAGSVFPLEFAWKATKGTHKLEVTVNNQTFSKMIEVSAKPAPVTTGPDMMMLLAIVAIVVVVAAIGGAFMLMGRRRAAAGPAEGYVDEVPPGEAPYEPMEQAPAPPEAPAEPGRQRPRRP